MKKEGDPIVDLIIIFVFLNSLGFPGAYTKAFGSIIGTLIEYTSFLLQLVLMLISSGDTILDIKVVDLKTKYRAIYFMLFTITACSVMVTISIPKQMISCIRLSTTAMFGMWIVDHYSIKRILELIFYTQILFIFFSVVFAVFFKRYRDWSSSYASYYIGLYGTKNEAGGELALGIGMQLLLLRVYQEEKKQISQLFLGVLVLQISLLFLTKHTGGYIVTLIPALYVMYFEKKWGVERRFPLAYLYIGASVGFILFALTVIQAFEPLLTSIGEDASLTGRVPLWQRVIEIMTMSHTLTGYGYGMFWFNDRAVDLFHAGFPPDSWAANMRAGAHNVLMDLWLNIGLLGIASYFYMLLDSMKKVKEMEEEQYLFCFIYIFSFMLHGFTERAFGTYDYHTLFLFLACALGCSREKKAVSTGIGG